MRPIQARELFELLLAACCAPMALAQTNPQIPQGQGGTVPTVQAGKAANFHGFGANGLIQVARNVPPEFGFGPSGGGTGGWEPITYSFDPQGSVAQRHTGPVPSDAWLFDAFGDRVGLWTLGQPLVRLHEPFGCVGSGVRLPIWSWTTRTRRTTTY